LADLNVLAHIFMLERRLIQHWISVLVFSFFYIIMIASSSWMLSGTYN